MFDSRMPPEVLTLRAPADSEESGGQHVYFRAFKNLDAEHGPLYSVLQVDGEAEARRAFRLVGANHGSYELIELISRPGMAGHQIEVKCGSLALDETTGAVFCDILPTESVDALAELNTSKDFHKNEKGRSSLLATSLKFPLEIVLDAGGLFQPRIGQ